MAFWKDFIKSELIDIVEFLDPSNDTLVHRFQRHDNEIKSGAKLVVRPGQTAVFVNEGQIADVFGPGTHTLVTQNLPILSTLKGWKYGFDSPFKAEVYFVSMTQYTDRKWGTKNPVMMRDPEFGPVRIRAFGTYAIKVAEPAKLVVEVAGTNAHFTVDGITDQLRNLIVSRFTDALGEGKIPVLDLAGNYDELGATLTGRISPEFAAYGIELTKVLVENISLPEEVERMLDKRSSMGVLGNMQQYTQFQAANAIEQAARNPGGGVAGDAMGLGLGFAMANQMSQTLGQPAAQPQAGGGADAPPPLPQQAAFFLALDGQQSGPYDSAALRDLARQGRLTPETLAWRKGMPQWTPAAQIPEVADALGDVPPPLPPV